MAFLFLDRAVGSCYSADVGQLFLHTWTYTSGFRVQGSGFRVQSSGFRVQGSGFRVQGSGFRVQGPGFKLGLRVGYRLGFGLTLRGKSVARVRDRVRVRGLG